MQRIAASGLRRCEKILDEPGVLPENNAGECMIVKAQVRDDMEVLATYMRTQKNMYICRRAEANDTRINHLE